MVVVTVVIVLPCVVVGLPDRISLSSASCHVGLALGWTLVEQARGMSVVGVVLFAGLLDPETGVVCFGLLGSLPIERLLWLLLLAYSSSLYSGLLSLPALDSRMLPPSPFVGLAVARVRVRCFCRP